MMRHVTTYQRSAHAYASTPWLLERLEPRTLLSAATPDTDTPAELVAQANNQFAFDLYHQLAANSTGNVFFSPYSADTALEMVLQGANGQTATEMINALHLPASDIAQAGIAALYQLFQANPATAGYTLSTANQLWVNQNFPLLESFITSSQNTFGAAPETLDFSHPADSAQIINNWVSQETHGMIPKLIDPSEITPYTQLILANAVYFKGDWSSPFQPYATQDTTFNVSPTQTVTVPMMNQESDFDYYSQSGPDGFQALDMPYQGGNIDMLVILPTSSDLSGVQAELSPALFNQITGNLTTTDVQVSFPKFNLAETYYLGQPLQNLGIQTAFSKADFSGISSVPLHIGFVKQKTALQVDETGTQAAAVTVIGGFGDGCICCPIFSPVVFDANHPFIFALRDRATNTILFLGSVNNPTIESTDQAPVPTTPPPGDPSIPAVPTTLAASVTAFVVAASPSNVMTGLQSPTDVLNSSQGSVLV